MISMREKGGEDMEEQKCLIKSEKIENALKRLDDPTQELAQELIKTYVQGFVAGVKEKKRKIAKSRSQ